MPDNVIIKKFDSPLEYLEWASNAPTPWKGRLSSRSTENTHWYGTKNYDEAYRLAKYGWPEGLEKLAKQVDIAATLSPNVPNKRKRYDVAGTTPSPSRAAAGEPFAMATRGKDFKQKPVITLRTYFCFSSSTDVDSVTKWGAAICSYVNQLSRAGFSVQLDYYNEAKPSSGYDSSVSFQFPLKKAGEPLSLSNIAFWWMHPSSHRRVFFSALERLDVERSYESGYGYPRIVMQPKSDVFFVTIDDARDSIEGCLKVIKQKHLELLRANPIQGLAPKL